LATVKIEHASAVNISEPPTRMKNLLAACPGGQDGPRSDNTATLERRSFNIAGSDEPKHRDGSALFCDGRVKSDNVMLDIELNEVLGLNQPFLRRNRKAKLDGFIAEMTSWTADLWSVRIS